MAKFRESNITDLGLNYAREAANGVIKITFTKAVLSADQHQNDSLQSLQGLTSLNGFVQSDSINYATVAGEDNVVLPLRFRNNSMTADSYINTVGLYATDGATEVLYSVIVNDDPDLFPAYNGTTPESIKINYQTEVGRADQVNVTVSPLGMVTEDEFQPVKSQANNALQYRGQYNGNLLDVANLLDGYYQINNNTTNAPEGFDGYGYFQKKVVGADFYIELYDNFNHHWTNHHGNNTWDGWKQVPDTDEVNNIYQFRGEYDGNLLDVVNLKDGYYQLNGKNTNTPINFSGFGQFNVRHIGTDLYVSINDSFNHHWTNNYSSSNWTGWQQSADISDISSIFQYRGQYDGNLLDVATLLDGYYQINNNTNNAPDGFDGYGYFQKKVIGADFYVELYDNFNHHWTNHHGNGNWDGWMQVPDTDEVNNAISSLAANTSSAVAVASSNAANSISSASTSIQLNSSNINNLQSQVATKVSSNDAFINRGEYDGNLLDVATLLDGYYQINNNTTNAPDGFDGYGYFQKKVVGADFYVELYDNFNHHWTNHHGNGNWDGWKQVPDTDEVNSAISNLQNNINNKVNISDAFMGRGQYTGDLLNVAELDDGYYIIINNTTNAPSDFDGYGYFQKKVVGADFYIELYDNFNHHWTNHHGNNNWDGWIKVIDSDVTFINRGEYDGNLLDVAGLKDGYYMINGKYTNAPDGFSGYGEFDFRHVGTDLYIELADNYNNHWTNHYGNNNWDGWKQTVDDKSTFKSRGMYTGDLLSIVGLNDGYYSLYNNKTNAPDGFDGYGYFTKKHVDENATVDLYIELFDNANNHWTNHYGSGNWDGWVKVIGDTDINNLQTQINAVQQTSYTLNGTWYMDLFTIWKAKDGYWALEGNTINGPSGFNGWGIATVIHNHSDAFVKIWDSSNNEWRIHFYASGTNSGYQSC